MTTYTAIRLSYLANNKFNGTVKRIRRDVSHPDWSKISVRKMLFRARGRNNENLTIACILFKSILANNEVISRTQTSWFRFLNAGGTSFKMWHLEITNSPTKRRCQSHKIGQNIGFLYFLPRVESNLDCHILKVIDHDIFHLFVVKYNHSEARAFAKTPKSAI